MDLAYDGTEFRGWARQPGERTVQGELEAALGTVLRAPVGLEVAGRTDAGVHAWGQVASFELPGEAEPPPAARLRSSLNALTPAAIAVTSCEPARDRFDARRDAVSRTYCYRVQTGPFPSPFERGRALWWPYPLDRDLLDECAALLSGSHDFTAFTPTRTEHVRFEREIFAARWAEEAPFASLAAAPVLAFWIEADSFMRNMVRALAGTMLEVAGGRRSVDDFAGLLRGSSRSSAGETAPPHALHLARVRYP